LQLDGGSARDVSRLFARWRKCVSGAASIATCACSVQLLHNDRSATVLYHHSVPQPPGRLGDNQRVGDRRRAFQTHRRAFHCRPVRRWSVVDSNRHRHLRPICSSKITSASALSVYKPVRWHLTKIL